jgi:BirA family transcriptional regulator, biotin operon repressor / biotin---[acetyl-CoA-carboxylase] ligase
MTEPIETWNLDTERIGRRVLVFDSLDSTNTAAARMAASDETADGLALVAHFQSAGRGQYGRIWQSRPRGSLLLSVALRPPPEVRRPVILTALAAVAVAEAIYSLTGHQARIKWPNDLLVRGKKICGLLIEQHASTVVIGLGLNILQGAEEFEAEGLPAATSLAMTGGKEVPLRTAAEAVIGQLDREYARLIGGERVAVESDWKWRMGLLGRQVELEQMDGSRIEGRLHEMGFDGLELEVADGLFRVIVPETVAHLRGV